MTFEVPKYQYDYIDSVAGKYNQVKDAVHLIYSSYQEAVDDDEVLWRVYQTHFSHIMGRNTKRPVKYSVVERAGRDLRREQRLRVQRGQIPLYIESENARNNRGQLAYEYKTMFGKSHSKERNNTTLVRRDNSAY